MSAIRIRYALKDLLPKIMWIQEDPDLHHWFKKNYIPEFLWFLVKIARQ